MAELRGALIGCGFFAVNQMHGWRDVDGAAIVAICDRDPARLQIVGDQFGIERRYADAAELFAGEKLDFVDIATTVPSHRPLVEMAAANRVPVICQKPFAPSLDDAKAMVAACARAGVPLMVHENFRWQSPIQAVKRGDRQRRDRQAVLRAHLVPLGLRRLLRPALPGDGQALHHRGPRHPHPRHRALPAGRRRDHHRADGADQSAHRGRGRRDDADGPRGRRDVGRRLQLCDEARRRAVSRDASSRSTAARAPSGWSRATG